MIKYLGSKRLLLPAIILETELDKGSRWITAQDTLRIHTAGNPIVAGVSQALG